MKLRKKLERRIKDKSTKGDKLISYLLNYPEHFNNRLLKATFNHPNFSVKLYFDIYTRTYPAQIPPIKHLVEILETTEYTLIRLFATEVISSRIITILTKLEEIKDKPMSSWQNGVFYSYSLGSSVVQWRLNQDYDKFGYFKDIVENGPPRSSLAKNAFRDCKELLNKLEKQKEIFYSKEELKEFYNSIIYENTEKTLIEGITTAPARGAGRRDKSRKTN